MDMNRCVGVYKIYLIGGGGGGGGYYSFNYWYGDGGKRGQYGSDTHRMTPPLTVSGGHGGFASNGESDGLAGGQSVVSDSRGVSITQNGGAGGMAAVTAKNVSAQGASDLWGKINDRFSLVLSTSELPAPRFLTNMGSPGGSTSSGSTGGIIKAFRIG